MTLYEGIFIFSQPFYRENPDRAFGEIRGIVEKFGGKVVAIRLWSERSLAYEIKKVREASFVICHFEAPADSLGKIERGVLISDNILRCLIVKPEKGFDPFAVEDEAAPLKKDERREEGVAEMRSR